MLLWGHIVLETVKDGIATYEHMSKNLQHVQQQYERVMSAVLVDFARTFERALSVRSGNT